ncbi:MAG: ATP-binding protein [Spirochaetes bacterium]|nr:ATP-binding protein [Spirochaetota bacterium]
MAYRHRVLEYRLKKHLGLFPAVAVTGPRQSGKSTLLRAALPDFPYVSFDDPEEVQAAERDPRGFLSRFPERVILDEAQRAPGLFSYLKLAIDEDRQRKGRFVLSGSNQFSLSRRLSESLAGRIGLLELHPFERGEMPRAARAGQILRGSYPELTMRNHEGAREWYASYLATYLERDVRLANDVGKLSDFQTLVRLIAIRTSQEYNASALARDVGVSSKTVESWVSILEASYLVFRLRPWQANIGKRLVKRPKLFFWDTGLVCHLSGIRAEDALEEGPLGGPVLENLVIAEILKAAAHRGLDVEAHYFRESNGLESDLLIRDRERGRHWIVDVKSSHTAKAPWIESLGRVAALVEKPGNRAGSRRVVIYRGPTKRDWPTPGCDFLGLEDAIAEWQAEVR